MNKTPHTVDVVPLISLPISENHSFSYNAPSGLTVEKGALVAIPFGKQTVQGIVIRNSSEKTPNLKNISKIIANKIVTENELIWLEDLAKNSLESFPLILKNMVNVRKMSEKDVPQSIKRTENKWKTFVEQSDIDISKIISSANKGQTLVLIPENIFAQKISAMCEEHKKNYHIYNHKMGLKKRRLFLSDIGTKNQSIIISPQSGIFLPFGDLQRIIVYESSLPSHRQWSMRPHYDSRIAALLRARHQGIPIFLHSSLPFFELSEIGNKKNIPKLSSNNATIKILEKYPENNVDLLPETLKKIRETIDKKGSILIFHDSLGAESMYICGTCGHISTCDICGNILQKNAWALYCKTCLRNTGPIRAFCVKCGSPKVYPRKTGTRALEDSIKNAFPSLDVIRLDRENFDKNAHKEKTLSAKPFIVIATQKIFSYFSRPVFDLCVIPDPSTIFRSVNYDSLDIGLTILKRLDQLLFPQSYLLLESYAGFSRTLQGIEQGNISELIKNDMIDRKRLLFPPFASILYCEKEFLSQEKAEKEAKKIVELLRKDNASLADWSIIKKNNKVRGRILLRSQTKNIAALMHTIPSSWSLDPHVSLNSTFTK
jgi:primosomal protein N'